MSTTIYPNNVICPNNGLYLNTVDRQRKKICRFVETSVLWFRFFYHYNSMSTKLKLIMELRLPLSPWRKKLIYTPFYFQPQIQIEYKFYFQPWIHNWFKNCEHCNIQYHSNFNIWYLILILISNFNNHGWKNYTCLHSQFKIVKYLCLARLTFRKGVNFVIISFPSFSLLEEKPLKLVCTLQ